MNNGLDGENTESGNSKYDCTVKKIINVTFYFMQILRAVFEFDIIF